MRKGLAPIDTDETDQDQSEMRGFFAALRMTAHNKQPQVLRLRATRFAQDDGGGGLWDEAEEGAEVVASVGRGVGGDCFGGSGGDDLAAGVAALGAEVDDPVG